MAHLFHVRPWEIDLLSVSEFVSLCAAADEYREANSG